MSLFASVLEDVRFALRQLRKDRTVSVVLVVTIALGIGVNTAIFGMLNGFLRPLPARSPEQLVVLAEQVKGDETGMEFTFSFPALRDLREQAHEFSDILTYTPMIGGLSTGAKATQFFYASVTGNYFTGLGMKPLLGRLFEPGEGETPGTDFTLVLGYDYWKRRFAGDSAVVGTQVRIDGRLATIIGVTPRGFHGTYAGANLDGFLTLRALISDDAAWRRDMFTSRRVRPLTVMARLKPGVSIAAAQTSLDLIMQRLAAAYPETDKGTGATIMPEVVARPVPLTFVARVIPAIRFFVLFLAGLVLVVACLNVANIQLVRATARQRELAIRAALGSGRVRLIRQMLTESMLLVLLGTALGVVLGNWTANTVSKTLDLGTDLPTSLDFSFDWRVFAYVAGIAIAAGIVVGLLPALRASNVSVATLQDGSRGASGGRRRQRVRGALVVGQVAGSLVLLIVAGLFVRSLQNAARVDLGFNPDHVLNARMDPHWAGRTLEQTNNFYDELQRRVRAWSDVQSASLTFSVPISYINASMQLYLEGKAELPDERPPMVGANFVDPGYFATNEIPIMRGRGLRDSDDEKSPKVTVVNETMAQKFWPGQNVIGKRFYAGVEHTGPWEVVGIARNSKYLAVFENPLPHFYVPLRQDPVTMRILQIRSLTPPEQLSTRLVREIQAIDPDIAVAEVQTMNRSLLGAQGFLIFRVGAFQAAAMGLLGLILALVGVYGVVSYGAAQRTREIGIRMALGATPRSIRGIILRQGAGLVVIGLFVGVAGALGMSRVLKRFLLLVSAGDPLTFIAVPLALAAVALWACYIPARRATRVDPVVALRQD
ncbi:MAG TPA: ABC transporter permease [Gemmatimonadaceae bacterium]|nr:ABC transporter permease [Gemmatimonadaceae bacterium]